MANRNKSSAKIITLVICFIIIPLILVLLAVHPAAADVPKHYTEIPARKPPEIKLPDYQQFQLKNGMKVYFMEDHELPLVSGTLLVRTGSRHEPRDQVGLANLVATVMRTGGTATYSGEQLNQVLEQKAASIESGMAVNSGSVSFSALSEDLPQVLRLFAEVVQKPDFPQKKLDLAKFQIRGSIARRNDEPDDIAAREFRKLIYGNDNPYARTVEYATLDNISREDLISFHQTQFNPNQMILGIAGDFNPVTLRSQVEAELGGWKADRVRLDLTKLAQTKTPLNIRLRSRTDWQNPVQAEKGGVFFVNQPQLNQSSIQLGHLGGVVKDPDYPALSILNEVMNGLGGRMFNEVRSRQGLAYSVYASWSPQFDFPGLAIAGGETKSASTVSFVKSVIQELKRVREQPITAIELQRAKDSVINSFIFNFQDPAQTLSRLIRYDYFGYPQDFIFQYRKAVEATTAADVQKAAKKHLKPDQIVTLVVGNEKEIQPALATLNQPVKQLDITIPQPKATS
ncbi:MAG: pitrilysin family protein [Synechococcales bacterium]|nr:pitrilysin family protein [Synechococcales bacterium]